MDGEEWCYRTQCAAAGEEYLHIGFRFLDVNCQMSIVKCQTCFDTFTTSPAAAKATNSAVPPWLTNGRGTPVSGRTPTIAPILRNDCVRNQMMIPATRS